MSHVIRLRRYFWLKKKRILLTIKHFHISRPAPTKQGTNMWPPPRLQKVAKRCLHLSTDQIWPYALTVAVYSRDVQPQNCIPTFLFLLQASLLKKKRHLGMIRELVKDNRHKTNHTYLCAHYPCFVVSVLYSLHADSCHYLMGNSSKKAMSSTSAMYIHGVITCIWLKHCCCPSEIARTKFSEIYWNTHQ